MEDILNRVIRGDINLEQLLDMAETRNSLRTGGKAVASGRVSKPSPRVSKKRKGK